MHPIPFRWGIAAAAALIALSGCTTTRDTIFLVRRVDGAAKSRAVTDQGVALYELRVLGRGDYRALDEARSYFEVALRFDPDNTRARQYLETVDRFRETQLRTKTAQAADLLKKQARTEEETYTMLLLVRQSQSLSPGDQRAVSLRNDTEKVRVSLVRQMMDKARGDQERIRPEESAAQREDKLLLVKEQYDRIYAIQPESADLQIRRAGLRTELDRLFADGAVRTSRSIEARQYLEARDDIEKLDWLNRRLDNSHDNDIRDLTYRLNLSWAQTALEQKQLGVADARVEAALRAKRTDEAAALKRSIAEQQRPERPAAAAAPPAPSGGRAPAPAAAAVAPPPRPSSEAGVAEVQDLVRRGELVAANRRINALLRAYDDQATVASLREQQAAVRGRLPDLYSRGVEAYRQEDFNKAVDLLSAVVEIDVGYEQASAYLDKARAKQKLLEGLQGGKG
jgi:hypothetical protein